MNKHKAKCDKLKKIRKGIADKLGVDLHQQECTFEGNCTGTCPKCKQEEDVLNKEILKRATGLAVGATASLMLTACGPFSDDNIAGNIEIDPGTSSSYTSDNVMGGIGDVLKEREKNNQELEDGTELSGDVSIAEPIEEDVKSYNDNLTGGVSYAPLGFDKE